MMSKLRRAGNGRGTGTWDPINAGRSRRLHQALSRARCALARPSCTGGAQGATGCRKRCTCDTRPLWPARLRLCWETGTVGSNTPAPLPLGFLSSLGLSLLLSPWPPRKLVLPASHPRTVERKRPSSHLPPINSYPFSGRICLEIPHSSRTYPARPAPDQRNRFGNKSLRPFHPDRLLASTTDARSSFELQSPADHVPAGASGRVKGARRPCSVRCGRLPSGPSRWRFSPSHAGKEHR